MLELITITVLVCVVFYLLLRMSKALYWREHYKLEAEKWAAMVDELQAMLNEDLKAFTPTTAPQSSEAREAQALRREIAALQSQLQGKNHQIQLLIKENQDWKQRAETDVNMHPAYADKGSVPFDDTQINRLIRLCHPDKHKNSDVSNEITSWLISLRG